VKILNRKICSYIQLSNSKRRESLGNYREFGCEYVVNKQCYDLGTKEL